MTQKTIGAFLSFFLLGILCGYGQSNILASGGEATGSGGAVSYSVGQIDYRVVSDTGGSISQGVQQVFEIEELPLLLPSAPISETMEKEIVPMEMALFPNPASTHIVLSMNMDPSKGDMYQLFDVHGRLLKSEFLVSRSQTIRMERLEAATYFLHIRRNNSPIKSYKIIKN